MLSKSNGQPYMVFGRKWLELDNPRVDWNTNCVHIKRQDKTQWTIHPRKQIKTTKRVTFKSFSLKKLSKLAKQK